MSENLDNQNIIEDASVQQTAEMQNTKPGNNSNQYEDFMTGLAEYVIKQYNDLQTKENQKKDFIAKSLAEYNTDNYSKNEDFMNLYNEAIDVLGDTLDTKKFIGLLDKYVESRIASNARALSAKDENSSLTDSMTYNAGVSPKTKDNRRFQDLSDEELPLYIAKYL